MTDELEEEIESINAIYEDSVRHVGPRIYEISIPETLWKVRASFPSKYPISRPELLSLNGPRTSDDARKLELLKNILGSIFVEGMVCVFDFMESARDLLSKADEDEFESLDHVNGSSAAESSLLAKDPFWGWFVTEPIIDRKSVFIGHSSSVASKEEALYKINQLKTDKRIAKATHNITAWRIVRPNGVVIQDCDDNGESAAGGRLLHLLTLTESQNVVVVVSRWHGGILLGSDR